MDTLDRQSYEVETAILQNTIVQLVLDDLLDNGGATVALNGTSPATGYGVARFGFTARVNGVGLELAQGTNDIARQIRRYVQTHWALVLGGAHVGAWYNMGDGNIWLDLTDVIDSYTTASLAAQERGELAIWRFDDSTEIPV